MKKERMNDKGFSLVELIIVIAIMVILVAVLAPQYLRYVERGRNATDRDNATAIASAMMVWGTETNAPAGETLFTTGTATVTVTQGAAPAVAGANAAAVTSAIANAGMTNDFNNLRCQSQTAWVQYIVTVTVDTDGAVTVTNDLP